MSLPTITPATLTSIEAQFKKCVKGYHLINPSVIKETNWEDINTTIFTESGIDIHYKSDGSHSSGMDIDCSLGKISNKSSKYSKNKTSIDISSYRLTNICNANNCGNPTEIVTEINKRKNFDYYSVIVRDENKTSKSIIYDWFFIPCDYIALNPSSYIWEPTIGKQGKNKDCQVGWHTNIINGCKMSITFSMSSQLWMHIEMTEDIKKFIISSVEVSNTPKYNYISFYNSYNTL